MGCEGWCSCVVSTATPGSLKMEGVKVLVPPNHKGNSSGTVKRIKLKKPNQYGLYDMHGNAAEWVLDSYDPKAYIERTMTVNNPIIIRKNLYPRVVRGGSYKDSAQSLRSASRGFSSSAWKKRDPQIPKIQFSKCQISISEIPESRNLNSQNLRSQYLRSPNPEISKSQSPIYPAPIIYPVSWSGY